MMKKKKCTALVVGLTAILLIFSGCGHGYAGEGIVGRIADEVSYSVADSVNGMVTGMVDGIVTQVMDDVFDSIIEGMGDELDTSKQELKTFDSEGRHLYTVTDGKEVMMRVKNMVSEVLQWKRQIQVPEDAQLLYAYELWQEDQNSPLPAGERPLVKGVTARLYSAPSGYYFHTTVYEDESTIADGWYIPQTTAENMIQIKEANAL